MKKIALATAAVSILMTGAVSAADMAVKARPAPIPVPVPLLSWTGCYIGGNVGGVWAKTEQTRIGLADGTVLPAQDYGSATGTNVIGGGQVGCDYQFGGNWVVGVQGMFDFSETNSSHIIPPFPTFSSADRTKNMFTATARVGYLFAPQVLGYVKGGGAWTQTNSIVTIPAINFLSETSLNNNRSGWTVGGGLEWMFAPGWSVFGEYNYMDFGRKNIAYVPGPFTAPGSVGDLISTRLTAQTALVGVNYKFNFGGPVVARY